MSDARILLSQAYVGKREEEAIVRALRSGWVAPLGPEVDAFEREVAQRCGVRHALALASGTAALHLALLEAGVGPGDIVPVPTLTFAATTNAIAYTGATPYFVDCGADGNVTAAQLAAAVTALRAAGHQVKAALTVDLMGRSCDYPAILPALDGVTLIADSAEGLGALVDEQPAPSFARAAALSFNGNKILTTSGGGMLLSNDVELIEHARYLSTQARQPAPWYQHTDIGYNYRMSNILAALGRAQLTRLDEFIARRGAIRQRYAQLGEELGFRLLSTPDPRFTDNNWLTTIVLAEDAAASVDEVIAGLADRNIEARYLWKPMHLQPVYAGAPGLLDGTAERLFARGVTLPSGAGLSDADIDRVVAGLREILGR